MVGGSAGCLLIGCDQHLNHKNAYDFSRVALDSAYRLLFHVDVIVLHRHLFDRIASLHSIIVDQPCVKKHD